MNKCRLFLSQRHFYYIGCQNLHFYVRFGQGYFRYSCIPKQFIHLIT